MGWKSFFSSKKEGSSKDLPKPKDIPDTVARYLVVHLKKDPDWVWGLKAVVRRREESPDAFDVRVYDEAVVRSRGLILNNYFSLDGHADAVLYEGWFDRKKNIVEIRALSSVKEAA